MEEYKKNMGGRAKAYATPEALWGKCQEYFQWTEGNPIIEQKLVSFQGISTLEEVPRIRALTLPALLVHLGIKRQTWRSYKNDEQLGIVCETCENIIYATNFEYAAADMLNANLIGKQLGLTDKHDLVSSDGSMSQKSTIDVSKLSTEALREIVEAKIGEEAVA